jgi:short-subunit dehydrogenase
MNKLAADSATRSWALVTGASAGIGAEFCRQLAAMNYSIVLVARRLDRLEELASELRSRHDVQCLCISMDLSQPRCGHDLADRLEAEGISVDFLVNNAGYGVPGHFTECEWETHRKFVQVMVTTVCDLSWRLLPGMQQRGKGHIVNVASVAGFTPGTAGHTLYSASKAFLIRFTESLAHENLDSGINVSALCPGFTYSEFHDVSQTREIVNRLPSWMWMNADEVVQYGIAAVTRSPPRVVAIPGRANKIIVAITRLLPQTAVHALMRRQSRSYRDRTHSD